MKNLKTSKTLANLKGHQLTTTASGKVKGGGGCNAVPNHEGALN